MTSGGTPPSIAGPNNEWTTVMAPWAFVVAAGAISSSALLDPAVLNLGDLAWSIGMLVLASAASALATRRPKMGLSIVTPLAGTGWALMLILATGGSSSGLSLSLLLPVTWAAINLAPRDSLTVLISLAVAEYVVTVDPVSLGDGLRVRRVGIYLLVGSLIAYAIHALRKRLAQFDEQRSAANDRMRVTITALETRSREERELRRLMDRLHASQSRDDGFELIRQAAPSLFRSSGAISIIDPLTDELPAATTWVVSPDDPNVSIPVNCAVFRQASELTWQGQDHCDQMCAGVQATACRPLMRENTVVGIILARLPEDQTDSLPEWSADDEFRHLLAISAEQFSTWITTFELRESLRELSVRDPLTQLFNRRYFEATLDRELDVAQRTASPLAVLMVDIDHFKDFNDTFGHAIGDQILQSVATLLDEIFRGSDMAARTGGEEFTLVLPNCTSDVALVRAERLRSQLRDRVITVPGIGAVDPPTISIGIAASPPFGASREQLLRAADHALYRSKHAGRDQTSVARVLD